MWQPLLVHLILGAETPSAREGRKRPWLRLNPTPDQAAALLETLHQHAACFNSVAAYGWRHSEKNGIRLHRATYYEMRERFPTLPAQLVIAARVRATEAVKSALVRKNKGRSALPPAA